MKELNICIDIDGTVTDQYYWLAEANRYFGRDLKPEDVTVYDRDKVYGVTRQDYDCFDNEFSDELHNGVGMLDGANDVIRKLSELHRIHFVTAREEKMRDLSAGWLDKYGIPYDTLLLLGSSHKVQTAKELDCDLFIEDSLENAVELSKAGFKVLLMDCNYNKGFLAPGITRVRDWRQVESLLRGHPREKELIQVAG